MSHSISTPGNFRERIRMLRDAPEKTWSEWRRKAQDYVKGYYHLSEDFRERVLGELIPEGKPERVHTIN